jgi:hypothetical protein
MAELAIPLVALGGLYVVSNHNNDKKQVKSYQQQPQQLHKIQEPMQNLTPSQYPTQMVNVNNGHSQSIPPHMMQKQGNGSYSSTPSSYFTPNQSTDKYYQAPVVQRIEQHNPDRSVGGGSSSSGGLSGSVMGLTGEPIDKASFKHNNMVPFFGAKIRGASVDHHITEGTLDNKQGSGTQHFHKREQAPLFKPQADLHYTHGMPNMTDFMLSRQVPSMNMANIKPWEEQRVAPGLGLGYTTQSAGTGFNAGMEAREAWMPKGVDDLRVATNPKVSYELGGHQGPANAYIKEGGDIRTQGRIEKNRPDTDYVLGPSRWMTTTGIEKAPTVRGIEVLQDVNRPETTTEYFGTRADQGKATYVSGEYEPSHRIQLAGPNYNAAVATGKSQATTADYGHGTYKHLANNRATTKQPETYGGIHGLARAIVAPLMDILRPSRKEDAIEHLRPNGNVGSQMTTLGHIFNPGDRIKTTIKEQTGHLLDNNHLNVQGQNKDGYLVSKQTPVEQERDTTNIQYSGNAGPYGSVSETRTYDAEYRQRNNMNKVHVAHTNHGNTQSFNPSMNIQIAKREQDRVNPHPYAPPSARVHATPNIEMFGRVDVPQTYQDAQMNMDRINPDILTAFKNNPYTQSLHSF